MGLLLSVLSAVFAASKDLLSKKLSVQLDGTTSTFASFAFALPFYLVLLFGLRMAGAEVAALSVSFFYFVLLRAATDALAEGFKMHAFNHGDISLVATFFSLSPLFLLILSPWLTDDKLSWPAIGATLLVVGGSLLLVYHPTGRGWHEQRKGIVLATLAAVFFALNSCYDRLAVLEGKPTGGGFAGNLHTAAMAGFAMTLVSATFLAPLVIWRLQSLRAMRAQQNGLWVRGLLEVAFMTSKLTALQFLPAPYVVNIQRLALLLSIIGGRVFFKEEDFGRRLGAGALILIGVVVTAWL